MAFNLFKKSRKSITRDMYSEIRESAENGDIKSQYELGFMHRYGNRRLANLPEAFLWFSKAANQGDMEAQCELGSMYFSGAGVLKNYDEAEKWFLLSAEQGHIAGQLFLGSLYELILNRYTDALKWYEKAAAQEDADATYAIGYMIETGKCGFVDLDAAMLWYKLAAIRGNDDAKKRLKQNGL